MLFTLALTALGAPQFVADEPADAELARSAWKAAATCAGWTPQAHPTIRIERRAIQKGYLGLAASDDQGLYEIQLDPEHGGPQVLVHEVAHAWVHQGPTALVEGRAELLADCMVHQVPGLAPLQWDDGRELTAMPPLQSWDSQEDHGPTVDPLQRTDAYLGAARLVRLASLILPEGSLWPHQDQPFDWAQLDTLLTDAGEAGNPLRALLKADADVQQRALSDHDADGLVNLGEAMFRTDPNTFDTDGDGWWDGAAVPAGVQPVPFDGTPVCTGWALPAGGGTIDLHTGGGLRGAPAPSPRIRVAGRSWAPSPNGLKVRRSGSILVELEGDVSRSSGGLWARADGHGLVRDAHCHSDARMAVWADDPTLRTTVPKFTKALTAALERADNVFGPTTGRVAVQLGGGITTVDGPVVVIASTEIQAADGDLDVLANQAIAMRRVWDNSLHRSWRDVIAVSRALDPARVDALVQEDGAE